MDRHADAAPGAPLNHGILQALDETGARPTLQRAVRGRVAALAARTEQAGDRREVRDGVHRITNALKHEMARVRLRRERLQELLSRLIARQTVREHTACVHDVVRDPILTRSGRKHAHLIGQRGVAALETEARGAGAVREEKGGQIRVRTRPEPSRPPEQPHATAALLRLPRADRAAEAAHATDDHRHRSAGGLVPGRRRATQHDLARVGGLRHLTEGTSSIRDRLRNRPRRQEDALVEQTRQAQKLALHGHSRQEVDRQQHIVHVVPLHQELVLAPDVPLANLDHAPAAGDAAHGRADHAGRREGVQDDIHAPAGAAHRAQLGKVDAPRARDEAAALAGTEEAPLPLAARGRKELHAERRRDLRRREADAAGGSVHQHSHTAAAVHRMPEGRTRGQENGRNGRRVHVAQRVGLGRKRRVRHDAARQTPRRQTENAIADAAAGVAGDRTPDGADHAGEVRAGHPGVAGVHVQHVEHVAEVQTDRADRDVEASLVAVRGHLVGARSREPQIRQRATRLREDAEGRRQDHPRARAEGGLHRHAVSIARPVREVALRLTGLGRPPAAAAGRVHVEVHRIDAHIGELQRDRAQVAPCGPRCHIATLRSR